MFSPEQELSNQTTPSYEEFSIGARKRLFVNLLEETNEIISVNSPEKKKLKNDLNADEREKTNYHDEFRCSTPDDECTEISSFDDIFAYLKFHVYSYAIQNYSKDLFKLKMRKYEDNEVKKPKSLDLELTTGDAKQCHDESIGIQLAKNILKDQQAMETDEREILVKNSSQTLFTSEQNYKQLIDENKKVSISELGFRICEEVALDTEKRRPTFPDDEIETYLLPEVSY